MRRFIGAFLLVCLALAAGCGKKGPPVAPEDVKPKANPRPSSSSGTESNR